MKARVNNVFLLSVILSSYGMIQSEYSYMDTIRMSDNFVHDLTKQRDALCRVNLKKSALLYIGIKRKNTAPYLEACKKIDQIVSKPILIILLSDLKIANDLRENAPIHFKPNLQTPEDTLSNLEKYLHWYSNNNDLKTAKDILVNMGTYKCSEFIVEKGMDKISEYDSVKQITEKISPKDRQFIANNGNLLFSAAGTRLVNVIKKEGLDGVNTTNALNFTKDATTQIGCYATEAYLLNPIADKVMGKEQSLSKDMFSFALNYAAYYTICSAAGSKK
jgi:hypothetical protein